MFIAGGYDDIKSKKTNRIWYAISEELKYNKHFNIWRVSEIKLPYRIDGCQCIITMKETNDPSLIIIGGVNETQIKQTNHWEFKIKDIIGNDKFQYFIRKRHINVSTDSHNTMDTDLKNKQTWDEKHECQESKHKELLDEYATLRNCVKRKTRK